MLSILPYDHPQKETERPFKSYSRNSSSSIPNSIYGHFAPPMMSSMMTSMNSGSHNNLDLRPQMQYAASNLMDISATLPGRMGFNGLSTKYDMSGINDNMSPCNMSMMQSSFLSKQNSYLNGQQELNHSPVPQETSMPSPSISDTRNGMNHSPVLEVNNSSSSSEQGDDVLTKEEPHDSRMPPKKRPRSVPDDMKDEVYWEKRKKNNESAKRSRDSRRMKEEQIAMRVVYLEQDNLQLRTEVSLLKSEIEKLRCMLYNS